VSKPSSDNNVCPLLIVDLRNTYNKANGQAAANDALTGESTRTRDEGRVQITTLPYLTVTLFEFIGISLHSKAIQNCIGTRRCTDHKSKLLSSDFTVERTQTRA